MLIFILILLVMVDNIVILPKAMFMCVLSGKENICLSAPFDVWLRDCFEN